MIRNVRAHGHSEFLHSTADILPMPNRRQFHQSVRSGAASQASGQARRAARGQRRRDAVDYCSPGHILASLHRADDCGESAAQQVTLRAAARAALRLKRASDRIGDLVGHIINGCRPSVVAESTGALSTTASRRSPS
jgi:hypothetical protein